MGRFSISAAGIAAVTFVLQAAALVHGADAATAFRNPLNPGPDPYLAHHQGNYYLTTTQGNAVRIWKSPTLGGLKTAPAVTVWSDATGKAPSSCAGMGKSS